MNERAVAMHHCLPDSAIHVTSTSDYSIRIAVGDVAGAFGIEPALLRLCSSATAVTTATCPESSIERIKSAHDRQVIASDMPGWTEGPASTGGFWELLDGLHRQKHAVRRFCDLNKAIPLVELACLIVYSAKDAK